MDNNNELKQCELMILKEFISVCDKLKICYYLMGGTMLGAVRHHGFIPWDDDIDVGMPREDFEIFIEKGQDLLDHSLFIQTHDTDPEYPCAFAKVRNSNTTFIEASLRERNINHGVWIDVFPLDYYPEEPNNGKRMRLRWNRYSFRIGRECFSRVPQMDKAPLAKRVERNIRSFLYTLSMPNVERIIQKREQMITSVPKSNVYVNWSGAWGQKEVAPVDWYGEGLMTTFEGLQCRIPLEYDKWLTQVYGNYIELPPVEKRIGHHFSDGLDLYTPYLEYLKEHNNS